MRVLTCVSIVCMLYAIHKLRVSFAFTGADGKIEWSTEKKDDNSSLNHESGVIIVGQPGIYYVHSYLSYHNDSDRYPFEPHMPRQHTLHLKRANDQKTNPILHDVMLGCDVKSASQLAGVFKFESGDAIHVRSSHAHVIDNEFAPNHFSIHLL